MNKKRCHFVFALLQSLSVSKTSMKKKGRCVKYSMVKKGVISSFLLILPPNKLIGHIGQTNREIRFKTRQIFKSIFTVLLLNFLFFFLSYLPQEKCLN